MTATMTPCARSLLGVEPEARRRRQQQDGDAEVPAEVQQVPELRPVRSSAKQRATSYFNSFQTVCSPANDEPPSYENAVRQRLPQRPSNYLMEALPAYKCTVEMAIKVLINLESISPFHEPAESEWREACLVVRGTLISFHRVKDNGPGKLMRSYTLQHAEVGLAPDVQHTVLVPQTRLAHLIPSSARRKAWSKDPDLFRPVHQHLLRLRVETDQIVIANDYEDHIHSIITAISAGIDVAHAIDERSIPRQCTVPRRRRRQRPGQTGDINDPSVVAEQERILREMYPAFAEQTDDTRPTLERTVTSTSVDVPSDAPSTPTREEDDLDLAAIREDTAPTPTAARPAISRHTTSSSITSTYLPDPSTLHATSPDNLNPDTGKWQPPHTRTAQQNLRYIRRCMPVLLADAVRASDVLVCHGKRVKINWRMELLEEWTLQPPGYKAHAFDEANEGEDAAGAGLSLARTVSSCSQASDPARREADAANVSTSDLGESDRIERVEGRGTPDLELAKAAVVGVMGKERQSQARAQAARRHVGADVHGVVFCF